MSNTKPLIPYSFRLDAEQVEKANAKGIDVAALFRDTLDRALKVQKCTFVDFTPEGFSTLQRRAAELRARGAFITVETIHTTKPIAFRLWYWT